MNNATPTETFTDHQTTQDAPSADAVCRSCTALLLEGERCRVCGDHS